MSSIHLFLGLPLSLLSGGFHTFPISDVMRSERSSL
jgi:hypothetical protein